MLSSDLRDKLLAFADERLSLQELENWITPRLPAYMRQAETSDAEVVAAVELGLAEFTARIVTLDQLRARLLELVQDQRTVLVQAETATTAASSASESHHQAIVKTAALSAPMWQPFGQ